MKESLPHRNFTRNRWANLCKALRKDLVNSRHSEMKSQLFPLLLEENITCVRCPSAYSGNFYIPSHLGRKLRKVTNRPLDL